MKRVFPLLLCLLFAGPAAAEWPTTSYMPIPVDESFYQNSISANEITIEKFDRSVMLKGAFAVLTDVLRRGTLDSSKLEAAGFDAPVIQPLVTERATGDRYYPVYWSEPFGAPMRHGCTTRKQVFGNEPGVRYVLQVNTVPFAYSNIAQGYNAGGARRQYVMDWITSTLTHEVVHGIQNTTWTDLKCDDSGAPKWFAEGTADGIAHYLLFQRRPDAEEEYGAGRNQRRWDQSLDASGMSMGEAYDYMTGSFFRYLMEASGGLAVMKDMFAMPRANLKSRSGILGGIEAAIKKHSGGRGLYQVLPEFFTEYGSYGFGRYKADLFTPGATGALTHERWLDKSFGGCVEFDLTQGSTVTKSVRVDALAAECLHVKWTGFTTPVALQVFGDGKNKEYGDLHLGEAVRIDNTGTKYCYDATKKLKPRLGRKMKDKCMMRRETSDIGAKGTPPGKVAIWTSDFNLNGDGEVYLILSNVALKPAETKEIAIDFMVGAVAVESSQPRQNVVPRKSGASKPTNDGKTDIDKRVHAMNGNEKRMMFDARTVFGQSVGLGFMEGIRDQGTIGKGLLTVVRGKNYWVGFVDAKKKNKSSAFVIKDPAMFEATSGAAGNMGSSIVGGGPLKKKGGGRQCGYDMEPDITLVEQSRTQMKFRITVDMFDMRRAMSGAFGGSQCDIMRKAHVEKADFTVTLPYGNLYKGESTIERAHPPGQELYDNEEFDRGPVLGGIETSLQLAGVSTDDDAPPEDNASAPGSNGGSGTANPVGPPGKCGCACPNVAVPKEPYCIDACRKVWDRCR